MFLRFRAPGRHQESRVPREAVADPLQLRLRQAQLVRQSIDVGEEAER